MFNIKITTDTKTITLPKCYYSVGGEEVSKEVEMASGKLVKDVIGMRKLISGTWTYIPAADLAELVKAAHGGKYLQVEYLDLDNVIKKEMFAIAPIPATVFKYIGNIAVWTDVAIEMRSQEVS